MMLLTLRLWLGVGTGSDINLHSLEIGSLCSFYVSMVKAALRVPDLLIGQLKLEKKLLSSCFK